MTPIPPAWAMVMAMGASVTVSMAADISGIPTDSVREMRVWVLVSSGTTSERWGCRENVVKSQSVANAHGEKVLALFFVRVWERCRLENPQVRALWVERSL